MGMGNTQWGINRSDMTPLKTNVDVFWEDFYTRMVPKSKVKKTVEDFLGKWYSHLSDNDKKKIREKADRIVKGEEKYYYGGKRTRSSRSGKTRKQKRRVSKKKQTRRKH